MRLGSDVFDLLKIILWLTLLFPARVIVPLLPSRIVYILGGIGASLYYIAAKDIRDRIKKLFPVLMGEKNLYDVDRVIRRSFYNYVCNELEVLLYRKMTAININKFIDVLGTKNLDDALKKQMGVILLHVHFGNEHMLMPGLGHRGYKLSQIGLDPSDASGKLEDVINKKPHGVMKSWFELKSEYEKSLPVNFIYIKNSMRPAIEILSKNEILAVSLDGIGANMQKVKFLNTRAQFMTGPIRMALKTKVPVVPIFVVRKRNGKNVLIIEPEIESFKSVTEGVERFTAILGEYVKKYPCHYVRLLAYGKPPFGAME